MDFKTIIFWILLLLFTAPGFFFGFAKLVATADKISHFNRLGISIPMMRLLGLFEILSNIALFFPSTRMFGMGAWTVILLGANYFNISKKEPREELYASIGVLLLLGVLFVLNPG